MGVCPECHRDPREVDREFALIKQERDDAVATTLAAARELADNIIEKCEQYWNEHNIPDAEMHVILERIHEWTHKIKDLTAFRAADGEG